MGAKGTRTRPTPAKALADRDLEMLVRELVAHARDSASASKRAAGAAAPSEDESGEVLVDCEIDGVRCVLARARTPPPQALRLSPRELEIVRMVAKGHPNKVVASVLDISVWTVSTHLRRIFAKLGVTSRAAMVSRLLKDGKL